MNQHRKTLFISDLHLSENCPEITQCFLSFLQNCDPTYIEALYILGDFFEAWVGDDDLSAYHQQIMHALKSATKKGLLIYFIHGNRDFLVGNKFFHETGCKFLPDEQCIALYHIPVLIMHGDTLCTKDKNYLRFRHIVRNKLVQKLFLLLPLKIRRKIANQLRARSMLQSKTESMMDVTQEAVEKVMKKHHVTYLVHGHTHRPDIHQFHINQSIAKRIVLGAWHDHGNVLVWHESGSQELGSL